MPDLLWARVLPLPADPDPTAAGPDSVGMCLSGGGSRALSCALGQLRALRHLGKLEQLHSISSVSGGTWANTLFSYLPDAIADDDFLGPAVLDPAVLSVGLGAHPLDRLNPLSLGCVPTRLGLLSDLDAITQLKQHHGFPDDDLWQGLIGERVLAPYGLWAPDGGGFDPRWFSGDAAFLADEQGPLRLNPALQAADFRTRRSGRPQPVFNSAVFTDDSASADLLPFEAGTMLGVRSWNPAVPVGGGLVDAFAAGSSWLADGPGDTVQVAPAARRFALADIAGVSSVAFAQTLEERFAELSGLVPRYAVWPVRPGARAQGRELRFADGGSLENLGVNALLARGFRRLIVCINTAEPLRRDNGAAVVCSDLPPLFGLQPYAPGQGYRPWGPTRGSGPSALQRHSQVFPSRDFQALADGLLAAHEAGGTAMVEQTLDVQPNPWFAVPGGHPVRVLWICNAQVPAWWDALSWEVRAAVEAESLGHFPLYLTVEQLELSATLVNALAHLSCWNLASDSTRGHADGRSNAQAVLAMFG